MSAIRLSVRYPTGLTYAQITAAAGAENRYEYTVMGDAVNEAARLADHAKDWDSAVLCSANFLARADAAVPGNAGFWVPARLLGEGKLQLGQARGRTAGP